MLMRGRREPRDEAFLDLTRAPRPARMSPAKVTSVIDALRKPRAEPSGDQLASGREYKRGLRKPRDEAVLERVRAPRPARRGRPRHSDAQRSVEVWDAPPRTKLARSS